MKVKRIYYTNTFVKHFQKLPTLIQKQATKKEQLFRLNITSPSLKNHKLTGQLKDYYAFSINREYRILWALEKDGSATFIDVGTHSIYK